MKKTDRKKVLSIVILTIGILCVCLSIVLGVLNNTLDKNESVILYANAMQSASIGITEGSTLLFAVMDGIDKYEKKLSDEAIELDRENIEGIISDFHAVSALIKPEKLATFCTVMGAERELDFAESLGILRRFAKDSEYEELKESGKLAALQARYGETKIKGVDRELFALLTQAEWRGLFEAILRIDNQLSDKETTDALIASIERLIQAYHSTENGDERATARQLFEDAEGLCAQLKFILAQNDAIVSTSRIAALLFRKNDMAAYASYADLITPTTVSFLERTAEKGVTDVFYNLYLDYDYMQKKNTKAKLAVDVAQLLLPIYRSFQQPDTADIDTAIIALLPLLNTTKIPTPVQLVSFADRFFAYDVRTLTPRQLNEVEYELTSLFGAEKGNA